MDTAPTRTRAAAQQAAAHPSAPLPEVGPPVAEGPRVPLGRSGLSVYPFALGTAEFGRVNDARAVTAILDRYVQSGGNVVHVNDGDDDTVGLVGDWIRSRGVRDDVVVAARVRVPRPGSGDSLASRVGDLLARLCTDHLDVVTLDVQPERHSGAVLEQALSAAETLTARHEVRALGAYGLTATQLLEARVLASAGVPRIDVLETPYGLGDRSGYEGDTQRVVASQHVAVMPVRTVPRGLLEHDLLAMKPRLFHWRSRLTRALASVSREAGLTPVATALAWACAQPEVAAPIVDVFATRHVDDLAPAAHVELTRAQQARLGRSAAR